MQGWVDLCYMKATGRELNPRPVNRKSNALPLSHHATRMNRSLCDDDCRRHRSTCCLLPSCQHRPHWRWPSSATRRRKSLTPRRKRMSTSKICTLVEHVSLTAIIICAQKYWRKAASHVVLLGGRRWKCKTWKWNMQNWKMTEKLLANSERRTHGVWKMQVWKITVSSFSKLRTKLRGLKNDKPLHGVAYE